MSTIEKLISVINETFGEGIIVRASEVGAYETISTGIPSLDLITGIGGIPKGRITEIWGNQASGKTSLALLAARECQKDGGQVVFIDVEQTFDPNWAVYLGVDVHKLILVRPETAESALEICSKFVQPGIDLIIFDSIAALLPEEEKEKEFGNATVGITAKLMNIASRKFAVSTRKNNIAIIFTNQLRDKIGVYNPFAGPAEKTPGGRAIAFHASIRISLKVREWIKSGQDHIGDIVIARTEKNKCATPWRATKFAMYYRCYLAEEKCAECKQKYCPNKSGSFDVFSDMVKTAVTLNVIRRRGPIYEYKEFKWKGKDLMIDDLKEKPELIEELKRETHEISKQKI